MGHGSREKAVCGDELLLAPLEFPVKFWARGEGDGTGVALAAEEEA